MTLRRWRCRACELAFFSTAPYAMVACPGCGSPSLETAVEVGEIAMLLCTGCSTRFDLYLDKLDRSAEVLYCPRCKLGKPVPVGRLSGLSTGASSGGDG